MNACRRLNLPSCWRTSPESECRHDLNGDGKADLLWYNATSGQTAWIMNALALQTTPCSLQIHFGKDVDGGSDGDGKSDLIWSNTLNHQTAAWLMNGVTAKKASDFHKFQCNGFRNRQRHASFRLNMFEEIPSIPGVSTVAPNPGLRSFRQRTKCSGRCKQWHRLFACSIPFDFTSEFFMQSIQTATRSGRQI
jgi:hypothetical protein